MYSSPTTSSTPLLTSDQFDSMQSNFDANVCALLEEFNTPVSHNIKERLRISRQQALTSFLSAQLNHKPSNAANPAKTNLSNKSSNSPQLWFLRLACALPVLTLVLGFWGIGEWQKHEKIQAIAEVDMALLVDKLPPQAYADPGFEEFLQNTGAAYPPALNISTTEELVSL